MRYLFAALLPCFMACAEPPTPKSSLDLQLENESRKHTATLDSIRKSVDEQIWTRTQNKLQGKYAVDLVVEETDVRSIKKGEVYKETWTIKQSSVGLTLSINGARAVLLECDSKSHILGCDYEEDTPQGKKGYRIEIGPVEDAEPGEFKLSASKMYFTPDGLEVDYSARAIQK